MTRIVCCIRWVDYPRIIARAFSAVRHIRLIRIVTNIGYLGGIRHICCICIIIPLCFIDRICFIEWFSAICLITKWCIIQILSLILSICLIGINTIVLLIGWIWSVGIVDLIRFVCAISLIDLTCLVRIYGLICWVWSFIFISRVCSRSFIGGICSICCICGIWIFNFISDILWVSYVGIIVCIGGLIHICVFCRWGLTRFIWVICFVLIWLGIVIVFIFWYFFDGFIRRLWVVRIISLVVVICLAFWLCFVIICGWSWLWIRFIWLSVIAFFLRHFWFLFRIRILILLGICTIIFCLIIRLLVLFLIIILLCFIRINALFVNFPSIWKKLFCDKAICYCHVCIEDTGLFLFLHLLDQLLGKPCRLSVTKFGKIKLGRIKCRCLFALPFVHNVKFKVMIVTRVIGSNWLKAKLLIVANLAILKPAAILCIRMAVLVCTTGGQSFLFAQKRLAIKYEAILIHRLHWWTAVWHCRLNNDMQRCHN